ncbi:hypothetical protein C0J45_23144, partial [Silurus meridionalis]
SRQNGSKCKLVKHHIRTGEQAPIKQRAYRAAPGKWVEIEKQVAGLLADGVIEESCSPWASPVVLVRKKCSDWRFCVDYRRLTKVLNWPVPHSPSEVRAFVGLCSYYRRFVRGFSKLAAPLNQLVGKNVPFVWAPECDKSFNHLKSVLSSDPVVILPDFSVPFKIYTDASNLAVGAVLAQDRDGLECVVAYASRTLTSTQRRWSTFDRELWAVVWAVREFKHYIGLTSFTIITDQGPLLALWRMSIDNDPTCRQGRWILELDPLNWVIVHKDGHCHGNVDALSRRPESSILSEAEPSGKGVLDGASWRLRKFWTEFNHLSIIDGLLCRSVFCPHTGKPVVQMVVPSALVSDILLQLHGAPASAHFSSERVWERARQFCFWPSMYKNIKAWCEQCKACQMRRSPVPAHRAPMGGSQSVRPFERVAMDILELPATSKSNRYVLVVEDYFTKFVNLYALPNQSAQTVAQCLFEDYVLLHGVAETWRTR